jgi:hypothetical protein
VATFQRDQKTRTCVNCPACSYEIRLVSPLRLPGEFSVPCPNCGLRKVYESAEAHDPRPEPEVTKTSGRIQFATGRKKSKHLRTRLNEWVSSL